MTPEQLARVRFLVREDAWAEWERLMPGDTGAQALDAAQDEYRDLRLVAAYALETVCTSLRRQDAEAAASAGGQTKSYEAVGEWKEEFFAPVASALSVSADEFCRRASDLRAQANGEGRAARRQGSLTLPIKAGF